jgi:uncharacterized protein (TIGR02147 family)
VAAAVTSKTITGLPSVFEYTNFRKFLNDYQQARRDVDKNFTASEICRKIGLPNTRSYFRDVVNGKTVTPYYLEQFIRALGLNHEEAQFFRVLVQLNQADSDDQRELLFEQLIMLNRTPKAIIDRNAFLFYSSIHHSAIRALLDIDDFRDNYAGLANRVKPPLSPKKVRESIRLMKKLGIIKRDERGFWKPADKAIATEPYLKDEMIKRYQLKCIEMAKNALMKSDNGRSADLQNVSTNMISLSPQAYKRIETRMQKFKAEVRSIVHKDDKPAEWVYLLNLQLFPVTK